MNIRIALTPFVCREVSNRIDRVASVAEDLFAEWEQELSLYQDPDLRRSSKQ